jgi:hypothetical protein
MTTTLDLETGKACQQKARQQKARQQKARQQKARQQKAQARLRNGRDTDPPDLRAVGRAQARLRVGPEIGTLAVSAGQRRAS